MIVRIIGVVGNTVFVYTHVVDGHPEHFFNNVEFGLVTVPATSSFLVSFLTYTSTLKTEATCSSETGVATQKKALFVVTVVRT